MRVPDDMAFRSSDLRGNHGCTKFSTPTSLMPMRYFPCRTILYSFFWSIRYAPHYLLLVLYAELLDTIGQSRPALSVV